jgi:hypothetical protein
MNRMNLRNQTSQRFQKNLKHLEGHIRILLDRLQ